MTRDFATIPAIAAAASGKMADGELTFTFPEVLSVIKLCTANQIAVLGPDLFKLRSDGLYQTERLPAYAYDAEKQRLLNQKLAAAGWPEYVKASNDLAEEFVRQNPAGDDHVYSLTAVSWREFCRNEELRKSWVR